VPRRGGIGKATARLFAARGVHLALHYYTEHDVMNALVEELRPLGVRVGAFSADLADFDATRAMYKRVVEELGQPDILYSNAAMAGTMLGIKGRVQDVSIEEFEKSWRVNAGSPFLVSNQFRGENKTIRISGVVSSTMHPAHGRAGIWQNRILF
jgi:3-oxoacyl-[acyl-carrier protein] reductase